MGIPKYVLNFDELAKQLGDGININIDGKTDDLEDLFKRYFDELLELLRQFLRLNYAQCCISLHSYIPALQFDYELIHSFDENVFITGITYSQTGWKVTDCWSLYINDKLLFDEIFTKEVGEHKVFNAFYPVSAGETIKVVHHNNSGNSKQLWFDIDYFKEAPYMPPVPIPPPDPPIPPDPPPDIPEIIHKYDYMVVMRWEGNTVVDMDLSMEFVSKNSDHNKIKIYFAKKEYIENENVRVWLDVDYVSHDEQDAREKYPEIITVLGKPFDTAKIIVRNYNMYNEKENYLRDDVTVDIYKKDESGKQNIINHFSIAGNEFSIEKYDIEVCTIDLENETIY